MRKFLGLGVCLTLFLGLSLGFSSSTATIQSQSEGIQQQACKGLEVGEVDYNTSVEGRTLNFQGMFCAPNIGYNLESSDIVVEEDDIKARANISRPQGLSGQAIKPVSFEASTDLEPGDYNLEVRIDVEGYPNISNNTDLTVERPDTGMMQRIRSFFSGLFN